MAAKVHDEKLKNVVVDDSSSSSDDNDHESVLDGSSDVDDNERDSEEDELLGGLSLEKLSPGPPRGKKLLVLCLGGLLVHRVQKRDASRGAPSIQGRRRPDLVCGNYQVFKRPFCEQFLDFCFQRFEVGLWSSARERNMDYVLEFIIGDGMKRKLTFVWDQNDCVDSGIPTLQNKHKPIFLKELERIWENKERTQPWPTGKYSVSNTLLIDNDPYKALLNPPNTSIFPHPYEPNNNEDKFLGPKGELQVFLDGLADAAEVPSYVKQHAFGQPAITASHPDWNHYVQILRRFHWTHGARIMNDV